MIKTSYTYNFPRSVIADVVEIPDTAFGGPSSLARDIIRGENLIKIWVEHEHLIPKTLTALWGVNKSEIRGMQNDPEITYRQLNGDQIISLAKHIGVHPANLSPLQNDPVFSLPPAVLMANQLIANDENETAMNRDLARLAIYKEKERYKAFMAGKYTFDKGMMKRLANIFNIAVYDRSIDGIIEQLSVQDYTMIAPMVIDKILQDECMAANNYIKTKNNLNNELMVAKYNLCQCVEYLFGDDLPDTKIFQFALDITEQSLYITKNPKLFIRTIAEKITEELADWEISTKQSFAHIKPYDVHNLARVSFRYAIAKWEMDLFKENNGFDKYKEFEMNIEFLNKAQQFVNSKHGVYICNLFANQAILQHNLD